jgi:hypothetical protein
VNDVVMLALTKVRGVTRNSLKGEFLIAPVRSDFLDGRFEQADCKLLIKLLSHVCVDVDMLMDVSDA